MKAGKSTILNAIVGERVAPTDTTECTRVVTEYRHGLIYKAVGVMADGRRQSLRFDRTDLGAVIDLGGLDPEDYRRIEVEFPSAHLRDVILVDTPGVTSLNDRIGSAGRAIASARSVDLNIDVLICVMRQLDPADIDFLEVFRTPGIRALGTVNAIAVLARADEVGGGSPDAMRLAHDMAGSWQRVSSLQRLIAGVLPVAGLLAESAGAITEFDFRSMVQLADGVEPADASSLMSSDEFVRRSAARVTAPQADRLVRLLGLHGVVAGLRWIRLGLADTSTQFCEKLKAHSGIDELRHWVFGTLLERREVFKAQQRARCRRRRRHG